MKEDVPIRSNQSKYTSDEILDKIDYVMPAIEFAASRFSESKLPPAAIVADFAMNGCVILSTEHQISQAKLKSNIQQLAEITTQLDVNNVMVATNTTANVLGNPIHALTWLANELNAQGKMLKRNEIIITGAAIQYREIKPKDKLTLHFNNFDSKNILLNVETE